VPAAAPRVAAAQPARKAASQATRTARAAPPQVAAEPARPTFAAPVRIDPEPANGRNPPPVTANASNYQAVDQCRDKMFINRELCLAENCGKAGARNHPLCVRHREEVRVREEGKVRQGPQQAP
jgi:serine/threonine-protein kinase